MPAITFDGDSVLVAMSGGVDSTVCAKLLKDQGYKVHCAVFVFSDASEKAVDAAKGSCEALSLPLEIVDVKDSFRKNVVLPFCREYCDGRTPNPCVVCNPLVKFKTLCDTADRLGCSKISTGHYARVECKNGLFVLRTAACIARDQSYMLYSLTQEQLSRLILPLGELTKEHVRSVARETGLPSADEPDSQEICFIPDGDYPSYIKALGMTGKSGCFISPDGMRLGKHLGVEHYTIGQRRGLGVSLGKPVFVKKIRDDGDIELSFSGDEFSDGIEICSCVFNPGYSIKAGETYNVKIRSAAKPALCTVERLLGDTAQLRFASPQRAPAPGQSAVCYDNDAFVAFGGIIRSCY